jgi:hypothetical protein
MSQSLAILGGQPVRTRPFTSWPIFGESEEQRLLHPRSVKYKQRRQKANSCQFSSPAPTGQAFSRAITRSFPAATFFWRR